MIKFNMAFYYQIHGYKNGHQLLSSNFNLNRVDQETVDRLSDISGPLRPGETFHPYLTCYPLPSQEYFVIARTWQDTTIQRAGCVVTKSLLIPMHEWEMSTDISSIFQILLETTSNKDEILNMLPIRKFKLPPIILASTEELVEALFLENRQAILVFNCKEAEVITMRLYQVFWTTLRRKFSICTFSLSQRSIGGKPFDILFAPDNVKSKFSEWPGRRIDMSSKLIKNPRHRWTSDLAERVFYREKPTLFDSNSRSLFVLNNNSNENTFRLSLLWNELFLKAENEKSPLAILGLLDIINSIPDLTTDLYPKLQPHIYYALQVASSKLAFEDAWKFYLAFLSKYNVNFLTSQMENSIKKACAELTEDDPYLTIEIIADNNSTYRLNSSSLLGGLGDGIANYCKHTNDFNCLKKLPISLGQLIVGNSPELSKQIVTEIETYAVDEFINGILAAGPSQERLKATNNLSHYISDETHIPLLKTIFEYGDSQTFRNVTFAIGQNSQFQGRFFDKLMLENAVKYNQLEYLKDLVTSFDKMGHSDTLLTNIIERAPTLLNWLVNETKMSSNRKAKVYATLFRQPAKQLVDIASHDEIISNSILETLALPKTESHAEAFGTFLTFANIPVDDAVLKLNSLPNSSLQSINSDLITSFLSKAIMKTKLENENALLKLIIKLPQARASKIFADVTTQQDSRWEITLHIKRLLLGGNTIWKFLLEKVELVSQLLSSNLDDYMDDVIEVKWVELLNAAKYNKEAQTRSAVFMLNFSYSCDKYDPSVLICASFPKIYKAFLKNKSFGQAISFLFFPDWDRCLTLRQDLVSRYIASNWSRLGLFNVALETGIIKEVMAILLEVDGGKKYLNEAISEGKKMNYSSSKGQMQEILAALKKVNK